MAWVATAVVGGSVVGGIIQGNAAKDAANAQVGAANSANQIQLDMYNQNRNDQAPYRQAGFDALNTLLGRDSNYQKRSDLQGQLKFAQSESDRHQGLINGTPANGLGSGRLGEYQDAFGKNQASIADYQKQIDALGPEKTYTPQEVGQRLVEQDPSYQFRMDQGMKGVESSAAARGMLNSGRNMKELSRYGQEFASNEYGNAYNRLASMAGLGQTATAQTGQYGMNYANQAGQNFGNIGNAQAAGQIGQANAINGAISGGINSWMNNRFLTGKGW
jgi:hypothetical protein